MKFILTFLVLSLLSLIKANVIPVLAKASELAVRNATGADAALDIDSSVYAIDPRPYGAPCGMTWTVSMNVNEAGDQANTSPLCKYLYAVFNQPQGVGFIPKKYNFVYLCPPQWSEPTSGYGSETIKLIVTGPTLFPGAQTRIGATLTVRNTAIDAPTDIKVPVTIGYFYDDKNPAKLGFKFLTFENIRCTALN